MWDNRERLLMAFISADEWAVNNINRNLIFSCKICFDADLCLWKIEKMNFSKNSTKYVFFGRTRNLQVMPPASTGRCPEPHINHAVCTIDAVDLLEKLVCPKVGCIDNCFADLKFRDVICIECRFEKLLNFYSCKKPIFDLPKCP